MKSKTLKNILQNQSGMLATPHLPNWGYLTAPKAALWWPRFLQKLNLKQAIIAVSLGAAAPFYALALMSMAPRDIVFEYTNTTECFNQLTLVPSHRQAPSSQSFATEHRGGLSLAGRSLFSTETCLHAQAAPQENSQETLATSPAVLLPGKTTVQTKSYPEVAHTLVADKPIAINEELVFELQQPDSFFTYTLMANDRSADCSAEQTSLSCPAEALELKQSKDYELQLARSYDGQITDTPISQEVTTVSAVKLAKSSIKDGELRYDKPAELKLSFDKPIKSVDSITLTEGKDARPVAFQSSIDGKILTLSFESELAREQSFELNLTDLTATDRGILAKPITLSFSTSGGPRVASSSLASHGTAYAPRFTISFDSPVDATKLASLLTLTADNEAQTITRSISGNTVTVMPTVSLGACQSFSVNLAAGLISSHGVGGGAAWSRNSRTLCQQVSTIGSSVEGRGIRSYSFGNGGQTYLYVGGTHGSESSSVATLSSWIDDLEAQYSRIPSNARIIVVPNINPDGYVIGERRNANNVDLNRNFPANNWKKDVTVPGGTLVKNGGGTEPLSEPEAELIANYTLGLNPSLVLTYHARGSFAIANESGYSMAKANTYADLSGFSALANSNIAGIFDYDTTGAYEDWLHDKHGIPALLIELSTSTSNEYTQQQRAMWAMFE